MESAWVTISARWRFQRSTQTPAGGARKKAGICPQKLTTPRSTADPVSRYTSHAVATRVIQVPTRETVCPLKNNR